MNSSAIFTGSASSGSAGQNRNVYVASLPLQFDDQQLHNLFSPYGRIISARIMRAKKSHLSKGYGFVMFREAGGAEQAIQALHGRVVGGSRIQVRWASADASTTFSKVTHTPTQSNSNASSTSAAAANIATTANAMLPYPPAAANMYPTTLPPSQAYTFIAPTIQYEQHPQQQQQQQQVNAMALHRGFGTILNSPVLSAGQGGLMQAAFAAPSPPQQVLHPLTSTPPQQPVYVMVLPNGEHHIVQLNQLSFPNM